MSDDRTPPLADRIGQWTTPRPSPQDALAAPDEATGLRIAYEQSVAYRELAHATTAALASLTESHQQLRVYLRLALGENELLRAENERLRAELQNRQGE